MNRAAWLCLGGASILLSGCGFAIVPPLGTAKPPGGPTAAPAATATATATAVAAGAAQSLTTAQYSLQYPSGWVRQPLNQGPATGYTLVSSGSVDQFGIPPAGSVAISVIAGPFPPDLAPQSATLSQVAAETIGTPKAATNVQVAPYEQLTLGGRPAIGAVVTYSYNGSSDLQEDVLATQGSTVYIIELDTDPSMESAGAADLAQVLGSWRWTTPG